MSEKWIDAEKDYEAGMKYKDIAEKYEVSLSTVKSWKARKWSQEKVVTSVKKVAQKGRKVATKKKEVATQDDEAPPKLNPLQIAFVKRYWETGNATRSYMHVYDADYETANANSARLLAKASVQNELNRLKKEAEEQFADKRTAIINRLANQALGRFDDVVAAKTVTRHVYDEDGNPKLDPETLQLKTYRITETELRNDYDTAIVKNIKISEFGKLNVELYDAQKAAKEFLDRTTTNTGEAPREIIIQDNWAGGDDIS